MDRSLRARPLGWLLALLVALFAGPAGAIGEQAPDFSLRDVDNRAVSLSDFAGKVVLINFWATWCQPCQVEMPHLDRMQRELGDDGLVVLAISTDDARSASTVKPLVKRNGYSFRVLLDKETRVVSMYNPAKTLPYSVVVDRQGRIAYVHMGYTPGDEVEIREKVEALLAGTPN